MDAICGMVLISMCVSHLGKGTVSLGSVLQRL